MRNRADTIKALKYGAVFGFLYGAYYVIFQARLDAQHIGAGMAIVVGCMLSGMVLFTFVAIIRAWLMK
jgi:hypothetical protein